MKRSLQIGILNLMHNKVATNHDFQRILTTDPRYSVVLHFYYPPAHYRDQPIPLTVQQNLKPLDLQEVATLDAFIITGAPIEQIAFESVTYIQEIRALLQVLERIPNRLYFCWGAMVALHELYQVQKHELPKKIFGVYAHDILQKSQLLTGLSPGFYAPHARYAESNRLDIQQVPQLKEVAKSQTGHLFLVENQAETESFLFSHLEYGATGLQDEYQREIQAHPLQAPAKPEEKAASILTLARNEFSWQQTQRLFFENWLTKVQDHQN